MAIVVPRPVPEPTGTPVALRVQRRTTEEFIAAEPVQVNLIRPTRERTPSRGWRDVVPEEPNVDPQTMRLIPQSDEVAEVSTPSGRSDKPKFVLLAAWDADLEANDQFVFEGNRYLCATLRRRPVGAPYETKSDLVLIEGAG